MRLRRLMHGRTRLCNSPARCLDARSEYVARDLPNRLSEVDRDTRRLHRSAQHGCPPPRNRVPPTRSRTNPAAACTRRSDAYRASNPREQGWRAVETPPRSGESAGRSPILPPREGAFSQWREAAPVAVCFAPRRDTTVGLRGGVHPAIQRASRTEQHFEPQCRGGTCACDTLMRLRDSPKSAEFPPLAGSSQASIRRRNKHLCVGPILASIGGSETPLASGRDAQRWAPKLNGKFKPPCRFGR